MVAGVVGRRRAHHCGSERSGIELHYPADGPFPKPTAKHVDVVIVLGTQIDPSGLGELATQNAEGESGVRVAVMAARRAVAGVAACQHPKDDVIASREREYQQVLAEQLAGVRVGVEGIVMEDAAYRDHPGIAPSAARVDACWSAYARTAPACTSPSGIASA